MKMCVWPVVKNNGWGIGVVMENEGGYYETDYGVFDEVGAEKFAKHYNEKLGLSDDEVMSIVASSMRAQNERRK